MVLARICSWGTGNDTHLLDNRCIMSDERRSRACAHVYTIGVLLSENVNGDGNVSIEHKSTQKIRSVTRTRRKVKVERIRIEAIERR
jgi:hypothetical protein